MLTALLGPTIDPAAFVAEYWTQKALFSQPGLADGPAWISALSRLDIAELAALSTTRLVVTYVVDGRQRTLPAEPRHAVALYRDHGCTVCLSDVTPPSADMARAMKCDLADLAANLGLPAEAVQVNLYASPSGGGMAQHWDRTDGFIFQLAGTKTWRIATNRAVPNPRYNHVPGSYETYEVRGASVSCAPPADRDCEVHTLVPGSVLYLPRGDWHATQASGASVSIAIKIKPVTWAELIVRQLECELDASPAWRETAVGVWGDASLRPRALARLDELLAGLRARLLERPLTAVEVLRATNPESGLGAQLASSSVLLRNPAVRVELTREGDRTVLCAGLPAGQQTVLDVDRELDAVCTRVAGLATPCRADSLFANSDPTRGLELVTLLVEAGALSVAQEVP